VGDGSGLVDRAATELRAMLLARELSARELLAASLARIEAVNPQVNAIVTLSVERAERAATAADEAVAGGASHGLLHGLPVGHKDLFETAGTRTTWGSPLFADHVPDRTTLIVERMWRAGAVPVGKTNTPEFGAGSQTYNTVFGATRNPYDLTKTTGGSSGGSAAALAAGMVALADGSDYGASLRNPAAFCNVVGLRPTPGRVPTWPTETPSWTGSVHGPLGRTVDDVALLLTATAGPHDRVPISLPDGGDMFLPPIEPARAGTKIAWSRDLGGLPFDPQVLAVLEPHRLTLLGLGFAVADAEPDLDGFEEAFMTARFERFARIHGEAVRTHRDQVKDEIVWNVERGWSLTDDDREGADAARRRVHEAATGFFARYDYLVCPVTQVPPFSVDITWVKEIEGTHMDHYLQWLQSCYQFSVLGAPATSVPAGFTATGLPVGLQVVGRPGDDLGVLRVARAIEQDTEYWRTRPQLP